MDPESSGYVQSLARGLSVITAFGAEHPEMTLAEVARATGLSRAAARRVLHTLVQLGYVSTEGKTFALTPRVLELGFSYLSSIELPELAQPHLERLAAQVHESASVSVLDGDEIVYVARVPTSRIMTVAISIGTRFPAYATSMGHVLLAGLTAPEREDYLRRLHPEPLGPGTVASAGELRAELDTVAGQGWAIVDQELEAGLRSIAAPIRDREGRTVAAVNISTHASRVTKEHLRRELLPRLLETARAIEADLRHH
ncbi:IclR family transcriptional regulator domain-containing protein [Sciscionella marina]|uniref:IclR family transcriptional regulator domain-containing protein n=1 Tax=Sciscionella marina TaxID=508770 RepID=UPI000361CB64|nr:IclR family transcriptional regulator C-terminal domain-containing protein [Sciscionella marina]